MATLDEEKWELFLKTLQEQEEKWRAFREELTTEIREYKRTVNSAIGMLAEEAIRFQKITAERLVEDKDERQARQQQVDKKDRLLLGVAGCLILINGVGIAIIVAVVVYLLTR